MILALVALLLASDDHATARHPFDDVAKWSAIFDDPERDAWQKPGELIRWLGVSPGQTVADLGAGTGYLSVRLARAVGEEGTVLALDVEPNLVAHMKGRAEKEKLKAMRASLIAPDDPGLPASGVDLVVVLDTWHHIDGRVAYLAKVARGLKPGGRVAIVDWKKGAFPVGPPDDHKLTAEQVVDELRRGGFVLARRSDDLLPYQFALEFRPEAAPR